MTADELNAAITRAYIEFTTAAQDSSTTRVTFEIQASDNATAFAATPFNLHARPTYSQSVDWTIDYPWATVDQAHQSAELKDLVQKVVHQYGIQFTSLNRNDRKEIDRYISSLVRGDLPEAG